MSSVGQKAVALGTCLVPARMLSFFMTLGQVSSLGFGPLIFNKGWVPPGTLRVVEKMKRTDGLKVKCFRTHGILANTQHCQGCLVIWRWDQACGPTALYFFLS